jgi:predicted DNA-binding helix-hairpin-helix protein
MSDIERLQLLTSQMHLEPTEDYYPTPLPSHGQEAITVKAAQLPNGQRIRLLKTLLSSYCENNCAYCPFRSGRDMPRAAFTPDDFARLFISLYERKFVEGIFLSSSIFNGAIKTQDLLLTTASLLRNRYQFKGYFHLKIMPGAEKAQVEEAMMLADRLSINLEAPHDKALSFLAPKKDLITDLLTPLRWIEEIRQQKSPEYAWKGQWPSSTTQFVVGAAGESDFDILRTTQQLTRRNRISRAYFSSFNPIENTPFEELPPSPPLREYRLYQASYLIKDYGFNETEFIYQENGNLTLNKDPKLVWAEKHLINNPIEINTAPRGLLLRVPDIGPRKADQILNIRKENPLNSIDALLKARLISPKSSPYILVNGRSPARQLQFI